MKQVTIIPSSEVHNIEEFGDQTYYSISAEMGRLEQHYLYDLDVIDWQQVASYVKENETEHCNLNELVYDALKEQNVQTDINDEYLTYGNGTYGVSYYYENKQPKPVSKVVKDDECGYLYELHHGKGSMFVLGEQQGDEVVLYDDVTEDEMIRFCSCDFVALQLPQRYYDEMMSYL